MKIAKRATLEEIDRASWETFATDIGMAAPFVRRRVGELAAATQARIAGVSRAISTADINDEALEAYAGAIVARSGRVLRTV